MPARSDIEQFAFAVQEDRVLYTANVADFALIHADHLARGSSHPGIIVRTRQRMPVGMQLGAMAALPLSLVDGTLQDRMIYGRLRT